MARKFKNWLTAALTGVTLSLLIPAQAWAAQEGTPQLVLEAARKSRRGGGIGILGIVCCLAVVGLIVVAVVLISRKRKRRD